MSSFDEMIENFVLSFYISSEPTPSAQECEKDRALAPTVDGCDWDARNVYGVEYNEMQKCRDFLYWTGKLSEEYSEIGGVLQIEERAKALKTVLDTEKKAFEDMYESGATPETSVEFLHRLKWYSIAREHHETMQQYCDDWWEKDPEGEEEEDAYVGQAADMLEMHGHMNPTANIAVHN